MTTQEFWAYIPEEIDISDPLCVIVETDVNNEGYFIIRLFLRVIIGGTWVMLPLLSSPDIGPEPEPEPGPEPPVTDLPPLVKPAPSTEGYQQFAIPSDGGEFSLEPEVDYLIQAPYIITKPVSFIGGRNIVWVAGHIQINDQGPDALPDYSRRGLTVSDWMNPRDRIVHLEGIRIDGDDLDEAIDIATPLAEVRVANCEAYGIHFRGSDDRDGTGAYVGYGNHPNALQTWGGARELWVDGFTFTHAYEGIRLQDDKLVSQDGPGEVHLRRVHMKAIGAGSVESIVYHGHTNLAWARDQGKVGKLFIDNGTVFSEHHVNSGWVSIKPNPRDWPSGFEAFQGGFYFDRAGRVVQKGRSRKKEGYTEYITDPNPGLSIPVDAFKVWPAAVETHPPSELFPYGYLIFGHEDFMGEDGTPALIELGPPTPEAQVPNGHAGLYYVSPS